MTSFATRFILTSATALLFAAAPVMAADAPAGAAPAPAAAPAAPVNTTATGVVQTVKFDKTAKTYALSLSIGNDTKSFTLSETTPVTQGGKKATAKVLKKGDEVTVTSDASGAVTSVDDTTEHKNKEKKKK